MNLLEPGMDEGNVTAADLAQAVIDFGKDFASKQYPAGTLSLDLELPEGADPSELAEEQLRPIAENFASFFSEQDTIDYELVLINSQRNSGQEYDCLRASITHCALLGAIRPVAFSVKSVPGRHHFFLFVWGNESYYTTARITVDYNIRPEKGKGLVDRVQNMGVVFSVRDEVHEDSYRLLYGDSEEIKGLLDEEDRLNNATTHELSPYTALATLDYFVNHVLKYEARDPNRAENRRLVQAFIAKHFGGED